MQTQIDFYILKEVYSQRKYWHTVATLAKKSWDKYESCLLYCIQQDLEFWDDFLWKFDPACFMPHSIMLDAIIEMKNHVYITDKYPNVAIPCVINLQDAPYKIDTSSRIVEIVFEDDSLKCKLRNKYQVYKRNKLPINIYEQVNSKWKKRTS